MKSNESYQSILNHLSLIPVNYLQEVDTYLGNLNKEIRRKKQNREIILNLAGSWNDMSKDDFSEFLLTAKRVGADMFNKEVEL